MKTEFNGCCICGSDLVYSGQSEMRRCDVCGVVKDSNAICANGHFVCDECHSADAADYIFKFCISTESINPGELLQVIMKNPVIKMHGPEHHFLVPAVLISAYYNAIGTPEQKETKLKTALSRSKNILGGFCGFYGTCGAGVGAGIFISVVLGATPVSGKEWQLSNLATAECLKAIALAGGPRCCKRDSFKAIETTVLFIKEHLNVDLESTPIKCTFSSKNRECLHDDCEYFGL
jgi:hypothetical protein